MSAPYIPYSGNKYRIAEKIYNVMRENFSFTNVVSLFCGGGSIELLLAQKGYNVLANNIDSSLIELHNHLLYGGDFPRELVPRDAFFEMKDDQNWLGAFIRQIYSFGNDQKSYLYSRERLKGDPSLLVEHGLRMKHLDDYRALSVQDKIRFISNDYRDVDLSAYNPEDTIIYCDPPYANTRGYHVGEFDHLAFYQWALECPFTVLISEYDMPEPFQCIATFDKLSEAGGGRQHKTVKEKLYCNKPIKVGLGL